MRIIKFALPLAAMMFFGAFGAYADSPKSKRSSSTQKSAAAKKKSSAGKSAKSSKSSRSKQRAKKSTKSQQQTVAKASQDWIDDLPEVDLPEEAGAPDTALYEPAPEPELVQDEPEP